LATLEEEIKQLIIRALDGSNNKKRNFVQSVELYLKFREVDLKKPENRFAIQVDLPNFPKEKENKIAVIASGDLAMRARNMGLPVVTREELESLAGNKKASRKLASQYDFFIAEASLMPLVGRVLGPFLGPKDRMPIIIPPNADLAPVVERLKRSVLLRMKTQSTISCMVGTENMPIEKIHENIMRILSAVEQKMPDARRKLDKVVVKTTMGAPVTYKVKRGK